MSSNTTPDFYCHTCSNEVKTTVDESNQEIQCIECGGNFVEKLGQGYDSFTLLPPPATNEHNSSTLRRRRSQSQSSSELRALRQRDQLYSSRNQTWQSEPVNQRQYSTTVINGVPVNFLVREIGQGQGSVGMIGSISMMASGESSARSNIGSLMSALLGSTRGGGGGGVDFEGGLFGGLGAGGSRSFEELLHHIMMNDSSIAGVPPATEEMIQTLVKEELTEESNLQALGECSICQESFQVGDIAVSLPCGHYYKEESIMHWLRMHNQCPVCRLQLPEVTAGNNSIITNEIS